MIKKFIILCSLVVLSYAALNEPDFRCRQDGVLAPEWTCNPYYEGMYTGIGVSSAKNIKQQIKEVEKIARDKIVNTLLKKKLRLKSGRKADIKTIKSWTSPSKTLYSLYAIPKDYFVKQSSIKTYKLSVKIPDNSSIQTMCKNKKTRKIVSRKDNKTLVLEESKCYITVKKKGYEKYLKKVILNKDTVVKVTLKPLKMNKQVVKKNTKQIISPKVAKKVVVKKKIKQVKKTKKKIENNSKDYIYNNPDLWEYKFITGLSFKSVAQNFYGDKNIKLIGANDKIDVHMPRNSHNIRLYFSTNIPVESIIVLADNQSKYNPLVMSFRMLAAFDVHASGVNEYQLYFPFSGNLKIIAKGKDGKYYASKVYSHSDSFYKKAYLKLNPKNIKKNIKEASIKTRALIGKDTLVKVKILQSLTITQRFIAKQSLVNTIRHVVVKHKDKIIYDLSMIIPKHSYMSFSFKGAIEGDNLDCIFTDMNGDRYHSVIKVKKPRIDVEREEFKKANTADLIKIFLNKYPNSDHKMALDSRFDILKKSNRIWMRKMETYTTVCKNDDTLIEAKILLNSLREDTFLLSWTVSVGLKDTDGAYWESYDDWHICDIKEKK